MQVKAETPFFGSLKNEKYKIFWKKTSFSRCAFKKHHFWKPYENALLYGMQQKVSVIFHIFRESPLRMGLKKHRFLYSFCVFKWFREEFSPGNAFEMFHYFWIFSKTHLRMRIFFAENQIISWNISLKPSKFAARIKFHKKVVCYENHISPSIWIKNSSPITGDICKKVDWASCCAV